MSHIHSEHTVFQGKFEHTLDEKGRLAVPSAFRRKLGDPEAGEITVVVTIGDKCLTAYPLPEWEQKLTALAKLNQFDPKVVAFKRLFVGCAQECQIDKAGRIQIGPELRRDAGLEKDAVVVGQIDKFEIWAAEHWQACFGNQHLTDGAGAIYASVAELGIAL